MYDVEIRIFRLGLPLNSRRKIVSAGSRLPVDRENDWVVVGVDHVTLSAMVRRKVCRTVFQCCVAQRSTC